MSVRAEVEYLAAKTERPIYYASGAGRDATHSVDQPMKIVSIQVNDARQRTGAEEVGEFGLHPSGFQLHKTPTRVQNFLDPEQISSSYEAEIETFLKALTGAYRVHVFDHTLRASDPDVREEKQLREPADLVHNDYTPSSGFTCLEQKVGAGSEALAKGRFQIVNVWRPLVDPVEDYPLALCDARSLGPNDVVDVERRSPTHTGEIQLAVHSAGQRWYYYPAMRPDEVITIKTFDSLNGGNTSCSIHTAIKLPDAPHNAKPRESIETRSLLFFH